MEKIEKKDVSIDYFQLLNRKVLELEIQLKTVHDESKDRLTEGNTSKSEMVLEDQLQKTLRIAKTAVRNSRPVPNPQNNNVVAIGNRVEIRFNEVKKVFRVEGLSGSPDVCSTESPLGLLIIGAKTGDEFAINNNKVLIVNIML